MLAGLWNQNGDAPTKFKEVQLVLTAGRRICPREPASYAMRLRSRRYFAVPAIVCPNPLLKDVTHRPAAAGLLEGVPTSMPVGQLSAMGSRTGYGGSPRNAQWTIDFPTLYRLAGAIVRGRSQFPHVSN
jgi:hypothetical protein